jgi:energy-coupling factor transporter ATP-binding protein EcfA2
MSLTEPALPPISLEIKPRGSKGFKSIRNIVWNDIPEFAVLTGRNGSGKSQLLLYLAHAFNEATDQQLPDLVELQFQLKGITFDPGDVAYIPNSGGLIQNAALSMSHLPNVKQQAFQQLRQATKFNGNRTPALHYRIY